MGIEIEGEEKECLRVSPLRAGQIAMALLDYLDVTFLLFGGLWFVDGRLEKG